MSATVIQIVKYSAKTNSQFLGPENSPKNKINLESESLFKVLSAKFFRARRGSEANQNQNTKATAGRGREREQKLYDDGEDEEKKWGKYTGLLLALLSSLVFSISALLVKYLPHYNPITIALWRFQGALWPALPFFACHQYTEYRTSKFRSVSAKSADAISEKLEKQSCETKSSNSNSNTRTHSKWTVFGLVTVRNYIHLLFALAIDS